MRKLFNITFLSLLLVGAVGCASPKTTENASKNTNATPGIKEQLAKGAFLVDVRSPEEFASGSAKGAVNIPLDQVQSRVKEFEGKPSVIVFCRSGNRSGQAKEILESNGIKNVTNGINAENIERETK